MKKDTGRRIALAAIICVMGVMLLACFSTHEGHPGQSAANGSSGDADASASGQDAPIPRMELEVSKVGDRLQGAFDGIGAGKVKGYLVVKNASSEVVGLHVRFSHQNADREEVGMHVDEFEAVAPGSTALLCDTTRDAGVTRVDYDLTSEKPDADIRPIGDGVSVEEASVDDQKLVVTIANATPDVVRLKDVRVEATGDGHVRKLGRSPGQQYLPSGSSDTITFDVGRLLNPEGFESWKDLERTYYLNGHLAEADRAGVEDATPGDAERVPSAELTVREVGKTLSGELDGAGPRGVKGYLLVKNETSEPVALDATFAYKRSSGKSLTGFDDSAEVVSPGESAMLCAKCYEEGVSDVEYELQSKKPEGWAKPLSGSVEVKEIAADATEVTIRITNEGPSRAFLASRRCVAKDIEGRTHAAEEYSASDLGPGESLDISFKKSSMFDPDVFHTWDGLERTYYIGGHVI